MCVRVTTYSAITIHFPGIASIRGLPCVFSPTSHAAGGGPRKRHVRSRFWVKPSARSYPTLHAAISVAFAPPPPPACALPSLGIRLQVPGRHRSRIRRLGVVPRGHRRQGVRRLHDRSQRAGHRAVDGRLGYLFIDRSVSKPLGGNSGVCACVGGAVQPRKMRCSLPAGGVYVCSLHRYGGVCAVVGLVVTKC